MSQIQISLVYNRKNKFNKKRETLIQICCYKNEKRTYFPIGIYIKPKNIKKKFISFNLIIRYYLLLNI